jgi:hypothetical protein
VQRGSDSQAPRNVDNTLAADFVGDANGHHVVGKCERARQFGGAVILAGVIAWRPRRLAIDLNRYRRILAHAPWRQTVFDGGVINEKLL